MTNIRQRQLLRPSRQPLGSGFAAWSRGLADIGHRQTGLPGPEIGWLNQHHAADRKAMDAAIGRLGRGSLSG
jgi:hypothetical protein